MEIQRTSATLQVRTPRYLWESLIALMEGASEGGSIIFPILAMNSRDSTSDELATFITVSSDFYADLGRYYRALTDAWLEERAREKPDES